MFQPQGLSLLIRAAIQGGNERQVRAETACRKFRMVLNDPKNMLNPRWPIGDEVSQQQIAPRGKILGIFKQLRFQSRQFLGCPWIEGHSCLRKLFVGPVSPGHRPGRNSSRNNVHVRGFRNTCGFCRVNHRDVAKVLSIIKTADINIHMPGFQDSRLVRGVEHSHDNINGRRHLVNHDGQSHLRILAHRLRQLLSQFLQRDFFVPQSHRPIFGNYQDQCVLCQSGVRLLIFSRHRWSYQVRFGTRGHRQRDQGQQHHGRESSRANPRCVRQGAVHDVLNPLRQAAARFQDTHQAHCGHLAS